MLYVSMWLMKCGSELCCALHCGANSPFPLFVTQSWAEQLWSWLEYPKIPTTCIVAVPFWTVGFCPLPLRVLVKLSMPSFSCLVFFVFNFSLAARELHEGAQDFIESEVEEYMDSNFVWSIKISLILIVNNAALPVKLIACLPIATY